MSFKQIIFITGIIWLFEFARRATQIFFEEYYRNFIDNNLFYYTELGSWLLSSLSIIIFLGYFYNYIKIEKFNSHQSSSASPIEFGQNSSISNRYSINDLEKFSKMKNEGILTEEEFTSIKKQILGI